MLHKRARFMMRKPRTGQIRRSGLRREIPSPHSGATARESHPFLRKHLPWLHSVFQAQSAVCLPAPRSPAASRTDQAPLPPALRRRQHVKHRSRNIRQDMTFDLLYHNYPDKDNPSSANHNHMPAGGLHKSPRGLLPAKPTRSSGSSSFFLLYTLPCCF